MNSQQPTGPASDSRATGAAPAGPEPFEDEIAACLADFLDCLESDGGSRSAIDPRSLPPQVQREIHRGQQCIARLLSAREQAAGATSLSESLPPGAKRVGRFQIHEVLGAGGFGIVYRAWDPAAERMVALKVPRVETLVNDELKSRFEQEARAAAKLDHPNLLPLLEAGSDGLLPFLVSPYCPGQTLAAWRQEHRDGISIRDAAKTVLSLAEGVAHAHARGVLHRDIKPSNIMLTRDDAAAADINGGALGSYVPKLMDFGLAKIVDAAVDMTRTGAMLGTPHYMPPEQAGGDIRAIGPTSDVYSMGAVLYELLAGQPPFADQSDLEVLRSIERDEPSRVRTLRRDVPRDLQSIVEKCLEKAPGRRYATAAELADDLRRWLHGEPTRARPLSQSERLWKWARRRPALASLMALAAGLVMSLLVVSLAYNRHAAGLVHLAQRQREAAREAAKLAQEQGAAAQAAAARAREHELETRRMAYVANVRLALEKWSSGQTRQTVELLNRYIPAPGEPDFRDFAWWLLKNMTEESIIVGRHPGGATAAAASPDGKWLASAGADRMIYVWNAATLEKTVELRGHGGDAINELAFSPDSAMLVSAEDAGVVGRWQIPSGRPLPPLRGSSAWLSDVVFSPDGKQIAAAGGDREIRLWNADSGQPAGLLRGHTYTVRALAFVGHNLYSSDENGGMRAWDINTMAPDARLKRASLSHNTGSYIYDLVHEPSKDLLLGALWGSGFMCWSLQDHEFGETKSRVFESESPRCIDCAPDGLVALGSGKGALHFARAVEDHQGRNSLFRVRHGHDDKLTGVAFVPGARQVFTASRDETVRLFQAPDCMGKAEQSVGTLRWRGNVLATYSNKPSCLYVYDVVERELRLLVSDELIASQYRALEVSPRHELAIVRARKHVRALRWGAGEVAWLIDLPDRGDNSLAIDGAEQWLAVGKSNDVQLHDLESGELRRSLAHSAAVMDFEFIPDTPLLASATKDGAVYLWHAGTGELVERRAICDGSADKLSISADGETLAVIGSEISIWRRADWQPLGTLARREGWRTLALVGRGDVLLAEELNGIRLFRVSDGAELLDLRGHCPFDLCAVHPDGQRIAVMKNFNIDVIDGRAE